VNVVSAAGRWLRALPFVLINVVAPHLIAAAYPAGAPTFAKDIAPLIMTHCVQCHRQGGIGSPMEFTSYEAVRSWAKAINSAVISRVMPPWSADQDHSLKFKNDARLSAAEISTFNNWVKAGTPKGVDAHQPDLLAASQDWQGPEGRKPDLVVSMTRDLQIPATGDLPYVQLLVPVPVGEDKWVSACQARPGNSAVVHHMAITELKVPNGLPMNDLDGLLAFMRQMHLPASILQPAVKSESDAIDMLAIYTPGSVTEKYDHDSAKLLRGGKNNYLAFNIHYTADGKPTTDRSQVAFWFRDSPPKHQILRVAMSGETILANGKELLTDTPGEKAEGTRMAIPPIAAGQADYELTGVTAFTRPITIFQLHPHAHFRAKEFKYSVVYPDGRELTLLTIPRYDFHWQLAYELQEPLSLPAGSKLVVTARYDNSANNEFNPAPSKEVFFRAQNLSTDEMFSPFVQYSEDVEKSAKPDGLPVVETIGCLVQSEKTDSWRLVNATVPVSVSAQATNSVDISKAEQAKPGNEDVQLVGVSAFHAGQYRGQIVAVRGVETEKRLNVTSLVTTSAACPTTNP
jgi:hypothetical protein